MTLSYEHRIIIQYVRNKFGHGVTRIVADHPEFDWNANTIKSFLQRINETGDVTRKEGLGRPRTARTEENIEQVGEMFCSQGNEWGTHQTPTEIANELEIDRWTYYAFYSQSFVVTSLLQTLDGRYKPRINQVSSLL